MIRKKKEVRINNSITISKFILNLTDSRNNTKLIYVSKPIDKLKVYEIQRSSLKYDQLFSCVILKIFLRKNMCEYTTNRFFFLVFSINHDYILCKKGHEIKANKFSQSK